MGLLYGIGEVLLAPIDGLGQQRIVREVQARAISERAPVLELVLQCALRVIERGPQLGACLLEPRIGSGDRDPQCFGFPGIELEVVTEPSPCAFTVGDVIAALRSFLKRRAGPGRCTIVAEPGPGLNDLFTTTRAQRRSQ